MSLGDINHELFADTFLGEVARELLSQQAGVSAHNAVFTGVIAGMTMEDTNADLLLGGLFGGLSDSAVGYIKRKSRRRGEDFRCWLAAMRSIRTQRASP